MLLYLAILLVFFHITCVLSLKNMDYRKFYVHSKISEDVRFQNFGFTEVFSEIFALQRDLLHQKFTPEQLAVTMYGYTWGKLTSDEPSNNDTDGSSSTYEDFYNSRLKDHLDKSGGQGLSHFMPRRDLQRIRQTGLRRFRRSKHDDNAHCCITDWWAVSPSIVKYKNRTYTVFHPSSNEFQTYFEGLCRGGSDSTCADGLGVCTEDLSSFTYILVYDTTMRTWPQLKFVPLQYPSYCLCDT